jgi:hypothetical protein
LAAHITHQTWLYVASGYFRKWNSLLKAFVTPTESASEVCDIDLNNILNENGRAKDRKNLDDAIKPPN